MACCYSYDCGEYAVSPMLTGACYPECEESPACVPCLPRCPKSPKDPKGVVYEKKPKKAYLTPFDPEYKERHIHKNPYSSPPCDNQDYGAAHVFCPTCHQPTYTPSQPTCKPSKTKYIMPCYRYEDGRIEQYVPTKHGRLPISAYRRNGIQDQIHGYRGAQRYLCARSGPAGCCVCTDVEPMCIVFSKVRQLPVSAFKRNGMQDQEHSKMLGTANFLVRHPRDVMVECDVCKHPVKVCNPAKVPRCSPAPNQPTALMRRACEVAVGNRKKPFMVSTTSTDHSGKVRKLQSEDEKDNRCYHCELKKSAHHTPGKAHPHMHPTLIPCDPCDPCYQCQPKLQPRRASSPECLFVECVRAKAVDPPETCYFYC